MANFDFVNSTSYKAWRTKKDFAQTFIIMTIIMVALLVVSFVLMFQGTTMFLGLGQVVLGLVILVESYLVAARYATTPVKNSQNLADRFSPSLIESMDQIYASAQQEGLIEITPAYFFEKATLFIEGLIIFNRLGLPFSKINAVKQKVMTPKFSADFVNIISTINTPGLIESEDLLEKVIESSPQIQSYLADAKINQKDFQTVLNWVRRMKKESITPKFYQQANVIAGIGEDWSYGYTPILSQYLTDLSCYFQDPNYTIDVFSHSNKLDDIQNILAKPSKNNCLLVGDPGVGKKTIVNALAAKIAHGDCLKPLKYKRIRQVDVGRLLGGDLGELTTRINNVMVEAINAGNIILFFDNFQSLIGGSGAEVGGADASQLLLPFLENSRVRIIASVTPDDYFSRIRNNQAIAESFEKIDIEPANISDTEGILLDYIGNVEHQYNIYFDFQALKTVVSLADRYVHDVPFPEKALRLVEEISTSLGNTGKLAFISPEDVEKFMSKKVNVPIGQAQEGEKTKLLNLENILHARVVGQEEAINAVSDALRRVRAGLTAGKRPVGVFMFLGPTGVGKTETAKALAESYFGSEKNMIRLDMSEYQQPNSIDRLLGSATNPSGILTDAILANPFSLILLDEIEKADKNVLNVFLQVFEDGRLTDVRGRVSDFTNAIIIATSNAGSEYIRENVGQINASQLKENLINKLQQDGVYTPEFLNRFDSVIVYRPLSIIELTKVASLMIADINQMLVEKKVSVTIEKDALQKLVELGNDPQFGARPMRRVIQEKIENLLAKKMLAGEVAEGQTLNVTLADLG